MSRWDEWITIPVTQDLITEAEERGRKQGREIRDPSGARNLRPHISASIDGMLGEVAYRRHFKIILANTFDYDFVTESGLRVDIKTLVRGVPPRPHFDCNVREAQYRMNKAFDLYVFCDLQKDGDIPVTVTLLGWLWKSEFKERSVPRDADYRLGNGRPVGEPMRCVTIEQLNAFPLPSQKQASLF